MKQLKNMKYIIIIVSSILSFGIFAQSTGSVSGKVIDQKTNEPLPYVTIVVKNNEAIVTGGITKYTGNFEITKLVPQK